ncbi:MAG: class I SAM-dependent methyltransferase [Kangiella sp.]|nr:class I SAM-dependent methyltransferase [Kangiella sp.]
MTKHDPIDEYFSGKKLYGNDFSEEEIKNWFIDEENGYYDLGAGNRDSYEYGYQALNCEYGFRHLPDGRFNRLLGIGSAYGDELKPVVNNFNQIVILEPSDGFQVKSLSNTPVTYVKPQPDGKMPFSDNHFDLITCFGVLHHIPNVSMVLNEIYRCLNSGGYALIREPTGSMGDWRKPRQGLTRHERGIPLKLFREIINDAGFNIVSERQCMFSLTSRLRYFLQKPVYNSRLAIFIDRMLCAIPIWADVYHPGNIFQKLRPASVFYVLKKP